MHEHSHLALTGGFIGWASFAIVRFNAARGMAASIIIGAVGGLIGGDVLAPLLGSPPVAATFDFFGLFLAAAVAAAGLTIGNMLHQSFGV